MSEAITVTSLRKVFTFPFQGENWQSRFLVGAALNLAGFVIPLLPLIFVYGYLLQIIRRAVEGEDPGLPAWEDWGRLGADGLRLLLVGLVFLLPGLVVFYGGLGFYFGTTFALPLAAESGSEGAAIAFSLLFLAALGIMFFAAFVGSLLFLLGAIPLPVAVAHFAVRDRVSAAFRVREWWPLLWGNRLGYFIAWVMVFGLSAILYAVLTMAYYAVVLCCAIPVLAAPIGFYVSLVSAALFGQTYHESVAMRPAGEPATAT